MSFHMVLPSNSCPNTQPNNVAGKFIIDMQNGIKFDDGDWEVALTEFSFTFMPSNIEKGKHITYYYKEDTTSSYEYIFCAVNGSLTVCKSEEYNTKGMYVMSEPVNTDDLVITIFAKGGRVRIVNSKQYDMEVTFKTKKDAEEFGYTINTRKGKEVFGINPFLQNTKEIPVNIKLYYKKEVSKIILLDENIRVESNEKVVEKIKSTFSTVFSNVVLENNLLICTVNANIIKVAIEPTFAKLLGFDKADFDTSTNKKIVATQSIKPKFGQNYMYIYMNNIEPILVGDTYAPLLKTIWLEHEKYKPGDVVTVTPKIPMYIPVSSSSINNIEVNIRSDNGNIIDFGFGAKSVLTLHFRKK